MRIFGKILGISAMLACAVVAAATAAPPAQYDPAPIYCYQQNPGTLCPALPGDIGPDPALHQKTLGYKGVASGLPTDFSHDIESPFDNYSWQTFVALNWKAGAQVQPPNVGLKGDGPRVWQGWQRVSQVFGNSPVQANCKPNGGEQVFSIAAKTDGSPATRNEEYIQAATGKPAIDVDGNWTLYERRVNNVEIAYINAPGGSGKWPLNTYWGQQNFIAAGTNKVSFPHFGPSSPNGAMEIKAAWRILDPKNHKANAQRFYVIAALVAVAPALVDHGGKPGPQICAHVDLGLVAMHIIQRNQPTTTPLKPQWFWSTFEHVDNAPLAAKPCDITDPAVCSNDVNVVNKLPCPPSLPLGQTNYSYFNARYASLPTNQPPEKPASAKAFLWNPAPPYARKYLAPTPDGIGAGTQIARCWGIYPLTQKLNAKWQGQLRAAGSVFANYMLVGTQWGAAIEGGSKPVGPNDGAPNYLSNSVIETYLQTFWENNPKDPYAGFNTGSCVSCHNLAALTATRSDGSAVRADFSFLPSEVNANLNRREFLKPIPR